MQRFGGRGQLVDTIQMRALWARAVMAGGPYVDKVPFRKEPTTDLLTSAEDRHVAAYRNRVDRVCVRFSLSGSHGKGGV